jgi:para-nitrobenzyl esterase
LLGTTWQLVTFEGDGRSLTPDDPAKYTIALAGKGRVSARFDCNRGSGTWKSTPERQQEFGPLALTRAMCKGPSMHDQIARQWTSVRSFVVKNDQLFLSLIADGDTYEFAPAKANKP